MSLQAITFDIWDTIIVDESDEPERARRGLRSKPEERRHLLWEALSRDAAIEPAAVAAAYDAQEVAFRKAWYDDTITPGVAWRLHAMLDDLGRTLPAAALESLIEDYETMELGVMPGLVDGAADVIRDLAGRFKLAAVSDTIYTPGRNLRRLLAQHGVGTCFSGYAFSDEVGHAKPHADMFAEAARQLGTDFAHMVHIGDRDAKDVVGSQALGMKAVLFTAARDEGSRETTRADALADSYPALARAIEGLAAGA